MRAKIAWSSIRKLAILLAVWLVGVVAAWLIFSGRWPPLSVFLAAIASFVAGQVLPRLVVRAVRAARGRAARGRGGTAPGGGSGQGGGPAQGGGPRVSPGFVWKSYSGDPRGPYDVVLRDAGRFQIRVIKELREHTGLGLKESKDLVDQVPTVVLANAPEDVASAAAATLSAVGAEVFLRPSPQPEDGSDA